MIFFKKKFNSTEKVSIFARSLLKVDFDKNARKTHPRTFKGNLQKHFNSTRVHKIRMLQQLERSENNLTVCYYELVLNDMLYGTPNMADFENEAVGVEDRILATKFDHANCKIICISLLNSPLA